MKKTDENLTEAIRKAIAVGLERVAASDMRGGYPNRAQVFAETSTNHWHTQLIAETVRMLVPLRKRS